MIKAKYIPLSFFLLLVLSALFSCGEIVPMHEVRLLDSLNQKAYDHRYKNLDSVYYYANKAYSNAKLYTQGKAEACNNLGFYEFMQMDFEDAERNYKEVFTLTSNELERLIADIGLMKIYQRTSMNKEYYDYRNSAINRMKRINEDITIFVDAHEKQRVKYALSEFYIVSAIYYYYLQQKPEAITALNQIKVDEVLIADTAQWLYYHYIKGSAGLCKDEESSEDLIICEFDNLYQCWRRSAEQNYIYFEANCLQGIAELLNTKSSSEVLYTRRANALRILNPHRSDPDLLPLELASQALSKFKIYNDIYQIAGTYRTIGTWLNEYGYYAEAVDTLTKALEQVNKHHQRYYNCNDSTDRLHPYIPEDTFYVDLKWINTDGIKTVPEWIARIREQLSVAYAGMEMKEASDYNRNIYLDILNYTRQDKELESRYEALEFESRELNILILFVIIGILLVVPLSWFHNNLREKRNKEEIYRLKQTLEICQKITASIPADASNVDEIVRSITSSIMPQLNSLFHIRSMRILLWDEDREEMVYTLQDEFADEETGEGYVYEGVRTDFPLTVPDKEYPIGTIEVYTPVKLSKDESALIKVIAPYMAWVIENGLTFISLGEERRRLEKELYVYEQHIIENKRQNLVKRACMSIVTGINPFIDRIINEISKLKGKEYARDEKVKQDKYQYIDELITRINEYNDILALWIKMKQGSLSLNVENFQLNELFEVIAKGRKTFEMKQQTFTVEPLDTIIKADKALTLFMINTLTENARKYTPKGGKVEVYAREGEDYVEISVKDNGRGLSEEDVSLILDEKIYDSSQIGIHSKEDIEELCNNKGSGFGLMNCKGIIEKYKKTSPVFNVCLFSIESKLGKGSRFYFRLPKGIRKTLGILLCFLLPSAFFSCGTHITEHSSSIPLEGEDTLSTFEQKEFENLLDEASLFADTAYFCNVEGEYSLALHYIELSILRLNEHYKKFATQPETYMRLTSNGPAAEIDWWNQSFASDYHVILDIRNEAAVAFLALKDLDAYRYNNNAYTILYKLLSEDTSLADYCRRLEHSTNNKIVGIILCFLLILLYLIGYYLFYIRRRFVNRRNLEQVLEINREIFAASLVRKSDTNNSMAIPQKIVNEVYDAINELLIIDALGLAVYNEDTRRLSFVFNPEQFEEQEMLSNLMRHSFEDKEYVVSEDLVCQCFPLLINVGDEQRCVGVLALAKQISTSRESDKLLAELIARFIAIVVYNAVVRLSIKYQDIETAQDEARRASREDGLIHVQNMVLDNCLSTIKHETIYYPNKIKQIIDKLNISGLPQQEEENVNTISELISYYKDIYTILSSCASRQLEEVTFRRNTIKVNELTDYAKKYFLRVSKKSGFKLSFTANPSDLKVTGDIILLKLLLENLINEAFSYVSEGELELKVHEDEGFVRFLFTDRRRTKSIDELNHLFYPNLSRMVLQEDGRLTGTEYLICKQVIRDHDEYAGKRGCRINAEPAGEGGFTVYFTIPKK